MAHGTLFIVSAASGTGKTSLLTALLKIVQNIRVSISYTTRAQRPGEEEGKSYFFTDEMRFEEMLQKNLFLEHAKVFDHSYGTAKSWVMDHLAAGVDIILEIDWQGAEQVRKVMPESKSIFILPPSLKSLRERHEKRGRDESTVIEKRIALAQDEISHCSEYDYLVVNDEFTHAIQALHAIIEAERLKIEKQTRRLQPLLQDLLMNAESSS